MCRLLAPADLNAATGEVYVAATFNPPGSCHWSTGESDAGYILGEIQPELSYVESVFATGGVDLTVSGRAAFYHPSQTLSSLWVDIGGARTLVLSFNQGDRDLSYFRPIAVQLAEIALSRI